MDKATWHRKTTALLVRVARELGIPTAERTIRSNRAGPAVGGEVTMSAPIYGVYVSLACPYNGYGDTDLWAFSFYRGACPESPYGTGLQFPNQQIPHGVDLEHFMLEHLPKLRARSA